MNTQTVTHKHAAGQVGGPGDNHAECACGIGFGGFDTFAEAMAELNRHIATESTARVEIGADGCGCPITGEIRTVNSTDVEGTERVEHRPGCWNAPKSPHRESWLTLAEYVSDIAGAFFELADTAKHAAPNYVGMDIQPDVIGDDELAVAQIDELAAALPVPPAEIKQMGKGYHHYKTYGPDSNPVTVRVYTSVSEAWVERRNALADAAATAAKIRSLEAEIESLRTAAASAEYAPEGRTTAVAEAKPDTYGQALSQHGGYGAPGMPALHDQALAEHAERGAETSCLHVLENGMRCDEPIRESFNGWVHSEVRDFGHNAVHHETPTT